MPRTEGFIGRIEGDQVYILKADRSIEVIDRSNVPDFARHGDFIIEDQASGRFHVNFEITEQHLREMRRLVDNLFD